MGLEQGISLLAQMMQGREAERRADKRFYREKAYQEEGQFKAFKLRAFSQDASELASAGNIAKAVGAIPEGGFKTTESRDKHLATQKENAFQQIEKEIDLKAHGSRISKRYAGQLKTLLMSSVETGVENVIAYKEAFTELESIKREFQSLEYEGNSDGMVNVLNYVKNNKISEVQYRGEELRKSYAQLEKNVQAYGMVTEWYEQTVQNEADDPTLKPDDAKNKKYMIQQALDVGNIRGAIARMNDYDSRLPVGSTKTEPSGYDEAIQSVVRRTEEARKARSSGKEYGKNIAMKQISINPASFDPKKLHIPQYRAQARITVENAFDNDKVLLDEYMDNIGGFIVDNKYTDEIEKYMEKGQYQEAIAILKDPNKRKQIAGWDTQTTGDEQHEDTAELQITDNLLYLLQRMDDMSSLHQSLDIDRRKLGYIPKAKKAPKYPTNKAPFKTDKDFMKKPSRWQNVKVDLKTLKPSKDGNLQDIAD